MDRSGWFIYLGYVCTNILMLHKYITTVKEKDAMNWKKSKVLEKVKGREKWCDFIIVFKKIIILKNRFWRERLAQVPRRHHIRLLHTQQTIVCFQGKPLLVHNKHFWSTNYMLFSKAAKVKMVESQIPGRPKGTTPVWAWYRRTDEAPQNSTLGASLYM